MSIGRWPVESVPSPAAKPAPGTPDGAKRTVIELNVIEQETTVELLRLDWSERASRVKPDTAKARFGGMLFTASKIHSGTEECA
jgi:hypothetical protein